MACGAGAVGIVLIGPAPRSPCSQISSCCALPASCCESNWMLRLPRIFSTLSCGCLLGAPIAAGLKGIGWNPQHDWLPKGSHQLDGQRRQSPLDEARRALPLASGLRRRSLVTLAARIARQAGGLSGGGELDLEHFAL